MRRLDAATADRWLATVVPTWFYVWVLLAIWTAGLLRWMTSPGHSWPPMLAGVGAVIVQPNVPRFGCLLGVGCGVLAMVLEPDRVARVIWMVLASACLVLLLLHRRARTRQRALGLGGGLRIRVAFDGRAHLGVFTDDEHEPRLVAVLAVDRPPELKDALAGVSEEDVRVRITAAHLQRFTGEAVLVGELVEGARPEIVTPAGVLRASRRWLRARRRGEKFTPLPKVAGPTVPSMRDVEMPDLPWTPRQVPAAGRVEWIVFGVLWVVGVVELVRWVGGRTLDEFAATAILAALLVPLIGVYHLCRRVVVDRDGLRITNILLDRTIPWSRVNAVKWWFGLEVVISLGGGRTRTLRFDGDHGRPSSQQVFGVLRTLRTMAPATDADATTRLSWGAYAITAYVAGIALAGYYLQARF